MLVSIIVPAFNIEAYLGRCLDSLVHQTYRSLEIIVVDDGSTDGTGSIADEYSKKDNRVVVVHQANQGVSAARDHGLKTAHGDCIGFCDGDDVAEPDMFEMLVKNMEANNVDISHCGFQMVFPDRIDYYHGTGEQISYSREEGLYALLCGKIEPSLCNKLYRSSLWGGVRYPEEIKNNEDLLCNYYLFKKARNSFFVDQPKYHYIIRKGSATTSKMNSHQIEDPIKVICEIMEDCKQNKRLYSVAYNRYISLLVYRATGKAYKDFRIPARALLKKEIAIIQRTDLLPKKTKYMALGVLYIPLVYRIVRKIYEKITHIDEKYKV